MKTEIFPKGTKVVRFLTKGIDDNHRGFERRAGADRRQFFYTAYLPERRHAGERRAFHKKRSVYLRGSMNSQLARIAHRFNFGGLSDEGFFGFQRTVVLFEHLNSRIIQSNQGFCQFGDGFTV